MSERPRYLIGGADWPDYWTDRDAADAADAADDAHRQDDDAGPETWPDVEWSTEQTFAGEFGAETAFGEHID